MGKKTVTDYEAIFNAADEAKRELIALGRKFLARTGQREDLPDADIEESPEDGLMGSWKLDYGRLRDGFVIVYIPVWSERNDDNAVYKIPARVIENFDGAVADAVEKIRERERAKARKIEAEKAAQEESERRMYERLKRKFEKEGV